MDAFRSGLVGADEAGTEAVLLEGSDEVDGGFWLELVGDLVEGLCKAEAAAGMITALLLVTALTLATDGLDVASATLDPVEASRSLLEAVDASWLLLLSVEFSVESFDWPLAADEGEEFEADSAL